MTREELIARCRKAPDVGDLKHEDFADFVTVIERRKRTDKGWTSEGTPYMSVDGRLAMANADHRRQGKRLDFESPTVLVDSDEQLTIMVVVDSEIYGRRHGIATSRKVDGAPIEMQHPWEIAETSAMGRALAAMGYGLIPGSGLASAEDMERSSERPPRDRASEPRPGDTGGQRQEVPAKPAARANGNGSGKGLSERQQAYLINAYMRANGVEPREAETQLDELCQERWGHSLAACTPMEGRELSLDLREPRRVEGSSEASQATAGAKPARTEQAPSLSTLSERQLLYLVTQYSRVHDLSVAEATKALDLVALERYGTKAAGMSRNEAAELSNDMRTAPDTTRPITPPPATSAPTAEEPSSVPASQPRPDQAPPTAPPPAPPQKAEPSWANDIRGKFAAQGWTANFCAAFIALEAAKGKAATEVMIDFNALKRRAKDNLPQLISDVFDEAEALGVMPEMAA
jgi:hypothetical protein